MMEGIYALMNTVLPLDALQFNFMKNAFLAILLLTPLLGLLGTMAVQQQMAFFSDALGHSALTGIGLGIVLGMRDDLLSMLIFGVVWAIAISRIKQTGTTSADTIISVFSSTSIALGLVILAHGGGFAKYSTLLIGDVLAVTPQDLLYLLIALVCGVVLWAVMYNALLLTGINVSLAQSRGIRTKLTEYAFAVLLAVAVMLAIRWVGVMLINALLILPAAAGRNLAKNARQHAVISVLIALICGIAGLLSAYYWDTSAGAAIVLYAAAAYGASRGIRTVRNRGGGRPPGEAAYRREAPPPDPLPKSGWVRVGSFFHAVCPCEVGAVPCVLCVVTAADRAAATYAAWGLILSHVRCRMTAPSAEGAKGDASADAEGGFRLCGGDQRALRSPFGNLRPLRGAIV